MNELEAALKATVSNEDGVSDDILDLLEKGVAAGIITLDQLESLKAIM